MINVNFDFKQTYNLDGLIVTDNSTYDSRPDVDNLKIELWDYNLGETPNEEDIYEFNIEPGSGEWVELWESIQSGVKLESSRFGLDEIKDGAYYFKVIVTDENEVEYTNIEAYGLNQETTNAFTDLNLNYDWTLRYKEDLVAINEITRLSNWFQALELSKDPASLIGTYQNILTGLRKYLKLT